MKKIVMVAATVLALAGCGSKDEAKNTGPKSMDEVKQEAAKLDTPRPGEYSQTIEVTKLDVPGMPAEAAQRMKDMMQASQKSTICLTKEDAEKGYRDMFKGMGKGDQCSYSKFDVDGGQLNAQMDCQSADHGKATMKLAGTVKADGSDVTVNMDTSGGPAPMGSMKMTMHMTTTRLGECKAS